MLALLAREGGEAAENAGLSLACWLGKRVAHGLGWGSIWARFPCAFELAACVCVFVCVWLRSAASSFIVPPSYSLQVRDVDLLGEEDTLGVATISLLSLPTGATHVPFRTSLISGARECGVVEGCIAIEPLGQARAV